MYAEFLTKKKEVLIALDPLVMERLAKQEEDSSKIEKKSVVFSIINDLQKSQASKFILET